MENKEMEGKEVDWLNLIGKTLMIIGALGPAGSARTREVAMNNALTVLRMQQEAEQNALERQMRERMHQKEMELQARGLDIREKAVGVQERMAKLKEKELELEERRLEETRRAFEEYIKFMMEGKEEVLYEELKKRSPQAQMNPTEPLKQIYPDLNIGGN